MRRCDFDQTSELQSQSRTVSTENQAKNVQNPFLFNNIKDGTILSQVIPGGTGTRPKACGAHKFNSLLKKNGCCSRVRLQLMAICCNRREGCGQYTSHVTFSHAVNTHELSHITLLGSRMCWCASRHLHGHPRCAVVRSLTLCSSPCSFPCVSSIFFSYLNLELNLFLHVAVIGAIYHWHSAN